jgi:hypothetical protein
LATVELMGPWRRTGALADGSRHGARPASSLMTDGCGYAWLVLYCDRVQVGAERWLTIASGLV